MVPSLHANAGQGTRTRHGSQPKKSHRQSSGDQTKVRISKSSNPLSRYDQSADWRSRLRIGRHERRRRAKTLSRGS